MKKLSTILSTILLSFLYVSHVFAVCESSDNFWNNLQNANYQFTYTLNNGTTQTAGASDGTLITANNVKAYGDLTTYFNLDHLWKYINFTGIITITSTVPNQLSNEFIINNMSSPTLLYQLDNGGFVEWGTCEFTSMTLNNMSEFVVNSQTGTDRYNQQNINYSVKCYAGENADSTRIQALRFHLWKNQYNSTTSMNANISIVHHLASDYQTYQGEYNNELCRIQELLQGISTGSSSGTTSQDIENQTQQIINNNNNNTQQIVDQLTNESCTQEQCSNLIDFSSAVNRTSRGITWAYNNNKVSLTGTTTSSGNYPLGGSSYNPNDYYLSGNNKFAVSQPLPYDLSVVVDLNCTLRAGQTSVICQSSSGQHYYNPRFLNLPANTVLNIQDLEMYLSSNLEQEFCSFGSVIENCTGSNRLDNINNSISDVNDTLNDSSTDGVSTEFQQIIDDFNFNDHGLTSFLLIPVNAAQNLLTATCTPVHLQFPYLNNKSIDLPCYSPIFDNNFLTLMTLIRICTNGIIAYYCVMQIYKMMINLSNPDHANIEVFEL